MAEDKTPAKEPTKVRIPFLAPPQQPDELGRLGRFRILKVLGKGGMGMVLKGEDPQLSRTVAIKIMLPDKANRGVARERFLREARAAAAIEHDHIISIYEVGEAEGIPYISMAFLKGMSLADWLQQKRPLTVPQIMRIGREVAKGLQAAHEKGMLHRDIKPANLWLDVAAQGRIKILDFGLARDEKEDTGLTKLGQIIGTPQYMSPEQASGSNTDGRTDLFSLGAVLYRLTTGELPFKGENTIQVLTALATQTPTHVCELNKEVPRPFGDLVMQLLEKAPEKRPASAKEIVLAITEIERDRLRARLGHADNQPATSQVLSVEDSEDSLLGSENVTPLRRQIRENGSKMPLLIGGIVGFALLSAAGLFWFLGVGDGSTQSKGSPATSSSSVASNSSRKPTDPPSETVDKPRIGITPTPTKPGDPPNPKPPVPPNPPVANIPAGFVSLFDCKSLNGWEIKQGAADDWQVVDGLLVGKGTRGWLGTKKEYRDFTLRLEWQASPGGNSGVFLRGSNVPGPAVEVDVGDFADPTRAGELWVFPTQNFAKIKTIAQRKTRVNDWNTTEISWKGDRLSVAMNDEPLYELDGQSEPRLAPLNLAAPVGLQIVGSIPVMYRSIVIRELDPPLVGKPLDPPVSNPQDWRHLFNGKDTTTDWRIGYNPNGNVRFEAVMEDGEPAIRTAGVGNLVSTTVLSNHHLRLQFKGTASDPRLIYCVGNRRDHDLHFTASGQGELNSTYNRILLDHAVWNANQVSTGDPIQLPLKMENLPFRPEGDWNTLELASFEGTILVVLNGKRLFATTRCRQVDENNVEQPVRGGTFAFGVRKDSRTFFRRVEVREIRAMPPELLRLAIHPLPSSVQPSPNPLKPISPSPPPPMKPFLLTDLKRDAIPAHELREAGGGDRGRAPPELVAVLHSSRQKHGWSVGAVVFSPDNKRYASADLKIIKVWEVGSPDPIHYLEGHTATIRSLAFNTDGTRLASGSEDKTIRIWDVNPKRPPSLIREPVRVLHGHDGNVDFLSWSANGKWLASGCHLKNLKIFDLITGKPLLELKLSQSVLGVAFHPNNRWLAYCFGPWHMPGPNELHVYDLITRKEVIAPIRHSETITNLQWSSDGKYLAAQFTPTVKVWNNSGKEVFALKDFTERVRATSFIGESTLVLADKKSVQVFDISEGKHLKTLKGSHPDTPFRCLAASPDGKHVAVARSRFVQVWNLETGEPAATIASDVDARYPFFSPDGRHMVWRESHAACLADLSQTEPIKRMSGYLINPIWSPDGKELAVATETTLQFRDPATLKVLRSANRHTRRIRSLAYHPLGDWIATGSEDESIIIWNLKGDPTKPPEVMATLRATGHDINLIAVSPDGRRIASGGHVGDFKVWDVEMGREVFALLGHTSTRDNYASALAYSPDGKWLVTGTTKDGVVKIFHANTGQPLVVPEIKPGSTPRVHFSRDGKTFFTGGELGQVVEWELPTGRRRRNWTCYGMVTGLGQATDGRHLAVGLAQGTVQIWRLP